MRNRRTCLMLICGWCGVLATGMAALAGDDPFADIVLAYNPGLGAEPGYTNDLTVLGSPERITGEFFRFPLVVSPFNPPFGPDEIVSLGAGGHLIVEFITPVQNDPNNPYGIDLIVFGNSGFIDSSGSVTGVFGADGGIVHVSADGTDWRTVPNVLADAPLPTLGFLDSGPYDPEPGRVPSDFTRPVDPLLTAGMFTGLTHSQVVSKYLGAGGGVGIDLSSVKLAQIKFVRIINPPDAQENVEVDAFSDVAPRAPGDANLDGHVDIDDLLAVVNAWGTVSPGMLPVDFDLNGVVNIDDLLTVINGWNP
jgi:hypothetical protein